jgi:hypothetical protein
MLDALLAEASSIPHWLLSGGRTVIMSVPLATWDWTWEETGQDKALYRKQCRALLVRNSYSACFPSLFVDLCEYIEGDGSLTDDSIEKGPCV